MKQLIILLFISFAALITSCKSGDQKDQISGEWTLSSFSSNGESEELTECDKNTTWNFTMEPAEALGDGTEVYKLMASAPDDCKYYGFDAKWTVKDGKLFISTSRIGGMGGNSLAGMMEIKKLSGNLMVIKTLKKELTFKR